MISVAEALDALFALAAPLPPETVPLRQAAGRRLAAPVEARRTQPPFSAAAMDGYAVKSAELERDAQFRVIGEAAAGRGFAGKVGPGQAVRIFTGAPMPEGADAVVIQEDVERRGELIAITAEHISTGNVRDAGSDFREGDAFSRDGPLRPRDIALLAAMNHAAVELRARPVVALIPTGDELVQPGEDPGPDQIIASNTYGLAALIEAEGAEARLLPAAKDTPESLRAALSLTAGADLIVTIGGASVGDHDIVGAVAADMGLERAFYKIAMRPGKPLMAGRLAGVPMVGLPGNPVSAMVCGTVFLVPMLRAMQGLPAQPAPRRRAPLAAPVAANGPREHYMRAIMSDEGLTALERQDSALLGVLADADCLLIRPPHDRGRAAGDVVDYIAL